MLLPFRVRRETKRSAPGLARTKANGNGHGNAVVTEGDFAQRLGLERKRAERSHKMLLLMLVDLRKLMAVERDAERLRRLVAELPASIRATDIGGWFKEDCILGLIFTELGTAEKHVVAGTIEARMRSLLCVRAGSEQADGIAITQIFFPDDWDVTQPGSRVGSRLYPDLFRDNPAKRGSRLLKRGVDIIGSSVLLILFSPLLAIVAALIKATSKGTVLFRQTRVGRYGAPFEFLKFRSMVATSDPGVHKKYVQRFISRQEGTQAGERRQAAVYKLKQDPRITPLGRFLRKTSLDELPQLWNVLRGEMSLVGPRPPIPYELECYQVWHRRRLLEAKPGMTGLWQVCGRSRMTFDEMVRLDLRYASNWSLWLDIKILAKTPQAVISGEGAY